MPKYAIIETGGKQYRVEEGQPVIVERLPGPRVGDRVIFDRVLLIREDGDLKIGQPYLEGAQVVGTLAEEFKGEKIKIFKYKPKKRYRRRRGHRQLHAKAIIEEIRG
jgi:large subunit ribosomal protein L21